MTLTREKLVPPKCKFFEDSIEVYVDHFSSKWVRMNSGQSTGKKLGCLAFLPIEMPSTRRPVLRVYVYDLTEGHKDVSKGLPICRVYHLAHKVGHPNRGLKTVNKDL